MRTSLTVQLLRIWASTHCRGCEFNLCSVSGWGTKIPHAMWPKKKMYMNHAIFRISTSLPIVSRRLSCKYLLSESESEVTQSCPTLCDPMGLNLPGSSVHGIFQARVLEWVAISFSRRSPRPRDRTRVSTLQAGALPSEPPGKPKKSRERVNSTVRWGLSRRQPQPLRLAK